MKPCFRRGEQISVTHLCSDLIHALKKCKLENEGNLSYNEMDCGIIVDNLKYT